MADCVIEDKGNYYQIINFDLESEDFRSIYSEIENSLKAKKQDVLLSLASVGVLYSSHLAMLVRMHQTMQKNGVRFGIIGISPEIGNLLQITQLDSIFSIYENLDDFKSGLKTEDGKAPEFSFEWQIVKIDETSVNVICNGNMHTSKQLEELQKSISDFNRINFDFSSLQSIDSASIVFLEKVAHGHKVSISGANERLVGQFSEKLPNITICQA
jgi:anti-anti-sigma factor